MTSSGATDRPTPIGASPPSPVALKLCEIMERKYPGTRWVPSPNGAYQLALQADIDALREAFRC